jgi:dCTP deaminase
MSLLSYVELVELVDQGVIQGVQPGAINAASVDVRLGMGFKRESANVSSHIVDLSQRQSIAFEDVDYEIILAPQEFVLAHTIETFILPLDISAAFCLKSSIARNGLEHLNACWADAGWNRSTLTMELKNMTRYHKLMIREGMFIGQMKLFRHTAVPEEFGYGVRGRYNGDAGVSAIKP